jgi:serine/threonine-protein kinase RsbW
VEITLSVHLPVDAHSVPFARAVCRQAFEHLQVERAVVEQITLALSEVCANVVRHAGQQDYEVVVEIDEHRCRISVLDSGTGFDPAAVSAAPGSLLDGGHGLAIVRALVDTLDVRRDPDGRHRVAFEKSLAPARV